MGGWSNTGAVAIFTIQVNLVDANGDIDGTLNGLTGLTLYGNGIAANPALQLTPNGDLVWSGVLVDQVAPQAIEIGSAFAPGGSETVMFPEIESGSFANDLASAIMPTSGTASGDYGAFVVALPFVIATQPGSSINSFTAETWHDVSFDNGWSVFGVGFNVQYRLSGDGMVLLQGLAKPGTNTEGITVFTLPADYSPAGEKIIEIAVATSGADPVSPVRIAIQANGQVQIFGSNFASFAGASFEGVQFAPATFVP